MRANGNVMRAFRLSFVCRYGVRISLRYIFSFLFESLLAYEKRERLGHEGTHFQGFLLFSPNRFQPVIETEKSGPTCGLSDWLISCDAQSHIFIPEPIQNPLRCKWKQFSVGHILINNQLQHTSCPLFSSFSLHTQFVSIHADQASDWTNNFFRLVSQVALQEEN